MSLSTQTSEVQRIARNVPKAVQALIQSNDIPTELHLNIMHDWKKSLDAALANLPDADTRTTQRRSVAVAVHRRIYRSVCSIVRRLPVEVLQAIFLELSTEPDSKSGKRGYDVFNVNAGPWPLIRVCRLWRAAALGCTELWATMTIAITDVTKRRRKRAYQFKDPVALSRAAFSNSGQRDLYIRLISDSTPLYSGDFTSLLLEHCHRWREAYIWIHALDVREFKCIGSRLERLKVLTYRAEGDDFSFWSPIADFRGAPNLVDVCVIDQPLNAIEGVTLPQVTKFSYCRTNRTGRGLVYYDPLDAFSLFPNVEDLSLDPATLPYDDYWVPKLVDMKDCIRRDRLTRFETCDVDHLYYLCLPCLSDLSLFLTDQVDFGRIFSRKPIIVSPAPLPALLAFLQRSGCALTKLMMHGANLHSETASLADIFRLMPGLERLEISYGCKALALSQVELDSIHNCMSFLVQHLSDSAGLLPNLETFLFGGFAEGEPEYRFVNADFVLMCRTRRPKLQVASLQCLGCPQKAFPRLKRNTEGPSDKDGNWLQVVGSDMSFWAILRAEDEETYKTDECDHIEQL